MKIVIALSFVLSLIVIIHGDCEVKTFKKKLVPACDPKDIRFKWPNHEDQGTYHSCLSVKKPVLITCPKGEVFVYVFQKCKSCDYYLPPLECSSLPTQNPPECVPIEDKKITTTSTTQTASTGSGESGESAESTASTASPASTASSASTASTASIASTALPASTTLPASTGSTITSPLPTPFYPSSTTSTSTNSSSAPTTTATGATTIDPTSLPSNTTNAGSSGSTTPAGGGNSHESSESHE